MAFLPLVMAWKYLVFLSPKASHICRLLCFQKFSSAWYALYSSELMVEISYVFGIALVITSSSLLRYSSICLWLFACVFWFHSIMTRWQLLIFFSTISGSSGFQVYAINFCTSILFLSLRSYRNMHFSFFWNHQSTWLSACDQIPQISGTHFFPKGKLLPMPYLTLLCPGGTLLGGFSVVLSRRGSCLSVEDRRDCTLKWRFWNL